MDNQNRKKISNYSILLDKKLGEGACGKVYIGEQDNTKLKVAVKVMEKKRVDRNYYLKSSLFSEIEILKTLKSPNIVGFLDVMESKNSYYIIQQFCDGGDLRDFMKRKGKFQEKDAILMLKQICNGFVELIKEGIMHRDLKPQNILVHQGQLKLADFGFSKKDRSKRMSAQTMVGTPLYMSIQILKGLPYSSKCDIWALGSIFYELMFNRTPWTGNSEYDLIRNIETQPIKYPHQVSKVTKDFISKCMGKDESKRFNWDELLCHQIFQGYFIKKQQQNKQFQNKFKTIMNNIRHQVKDNQIDLESNFQKLGVSKGSNMNSEQFQSLLKSVNENITKQQINFIFNKIANQGTTVSFEQFQKHLQRSGVPMAVIKKQEDLKDKASDPFGVLGGNLFDHLINQISNSNQNHLKGHKNGLGHMAVGGMQNINAMNQIALMQQQMSYGKVMAGNHGINNQMIGNGFGGFPPLIPLVNQPGGVYGNHRGWI